MDDLLTILTAMADSRAKAESPRDLFLDMCQRVVKYVAGVFGAKTDEVALLVLTSDGKHLRFAAPRKFFDLGTIPITKRDSIAVNIVLHRSIGMDDLRPRRSIVRISNRSAQPGTFLHRHTRAQSNEFLHRFGRGRHAAFAVRAFLQNHDLERAAHPRAQVEISEMTTTATSAVTIEPHLNIVRNPP